MSNLSKNAGQTDPQHAWAHMLWYAYLTGDRSRLDTKVRVIRQIFRWLPREPRCKVCNAPFKGVGGVLVNLIGFGAGRSSFNPSLCDRCEKIVKKHQVGLEMLLTMLFADVRSSTALAETVGPSSFHQLINRYYQVGVEALGKTDALINRLIGDALIGLYVPGIAGSDYVRRAVDGARALLEGMGYGSAGGPWIQVGIGIHTGVGYVGAVGYAEGVSDITVLGDAANVAARLASHAKGGEILVSEETCEAGNIDLQHCEPRVLELKGRNEPSVVRVLHFGQE
ncbi:MAG: adenylate/guanylate cyclase domain-containing protein [Anaerolineales bacterium]|jgi:adenylate cyclase